MTIRHFKWSHFSFPPRFKRWKADFFYKQEFTMEDVDYIHEDDEDSDQGDWNKLTGLKDYYFQPKRQTLMIGWRWNPTTQECEFNFYRHEDWGTERGPVELRCSKGDTLEVTFWRNNFYTDNEIVVHMWLKSDPTNVRVTTIAIDSAVFLVNTYFGGDRTPGEKIKIGLKTSKQFESNRYVDALGEDRR